MRLSVIPEIPPGLVMPLEQCGIRTDSDFLSMTTAEILRSLPPGVVSIGEIKRYKDIVMEATSAPGYPARSLLNSTSGNASPTVELSSSLGYITHLLAAHSGRVVELAGDRDSRKSELALNVVLHFLATSINHTTYWVDTTGDFSPEKVSNIASRIPEVVSRDAWITLESLLYLTQGVQNCLERIQLSPALEVEQLYDILDELLAFLKSGDGTFVPAIGYLVIDSITPLLGPLLSVASSQGHALMTNLMQQLKSIARDHSITIIVINDSTRNFPQRNSQEVTKKPALGPTFSFLTDATLWAAAESNLVSRLTILKSNFTPANAHATCSFDSGLYMSWNA